MPTNPKEPEESLDGGWGDTTESLSCGKLWREMARWREAVGKYLLNSVAGIARERIGLIRENLAGLKESC